MVYLGHHFITLANYLIIEVVEIIHTSLIPLGRATVKPHRFHMCIQEQVFFLAMTVLWGKVADFMLCDISTLFLSEKFL